MCYFVAISRHILGQPAVINRWFAVPHVHMLRKIVKVCLVLSQVLNSGTSTNPIPIAPKRTASSVDVIILPHRSQALLISIKIQPTVHDAGRVRGLHQAAADQSPVDQVFGGYDPRADAGDGFCDLGLEGVDVQDGVVLSGRVSTT